VNTYRDTPAQRLRDLLWNRQVPDDARMTVTLGELRDAFRDPADSLDALREALEAISNATPRPPRNALVLGEHYKAFASRLQEMARAALAGQWSPRNDEPEPRLISTAAGDRPSPEQVVTPLAATPLPPANPTLMGTIHRGGADRITPEERAENVRLTAALERRASKPEALGNDG
jgi:hypothetical protein